jgi:hypothetical protein
MTVGRHGDGHSHFMPVQAANDKQMARTSTNKDNGHFHNHCRDAFGKSPNYGK